jgi:hypothetical protein
MHDSPRAFNFLTMGSESLIEPGCHCGHAEASGGNKMRDHEAAMRVYCQLAVISDQSHQPQVRDRFLLLAGVAACRAGWPDVAARCHQKLLASNPAHQLKRHATMADALRDPEFQVLVVRWERYCPFEKAEAMVRQQNLPPTDPGEQAVGEQMLELLDNDTPVSPG